MPKPRKTRKAAMPTGNSTRHKSPVGWHPSNRGKKIIAMVVLSLATAAAYSNSLSATFVFDDRPHIFANERIKTVFPLSTTLSGRRPVVDFTLAVNHAIGGLDPTGYHLFNVVVHILSGLMLFLLLRRIGNGARPREKAGQETGGGLSIGVAAAVALLWMLHPLQTQSVTYVIQRGESLMGLCYLFTLYAAIRGMDGSGKRRWWLVASVAACGLGMATKAVMLTAPVLVLLYDWIVVTRSLRVTLRKRFAYYVALSSTLSLLVVCGVTSGVLSTGPHPHANVGFAVDGVTPWHYLLTQPGVLLHYLQLVVWPGPLCIDYGWPLVTSLSDAAFPGVVVLALLVWAVRACRHHPRAGFAGLSFFVILAPTSSLIPIRDPLFEHRMYLPLAAVLALLAAAVARMVRWSLRRVGADSRWSGYTCTVIVVLVAGALAVRTFDRNADYKSEIKLWEQATIVRPQNARAHYSLAVALGRAKRYAESLRSFRRVLKVSTDQTRCDVLAETHYHIGWSLIRQEQAGAAIAEFRQALALTPNHVEATFELGWGLAMLGRYEEAADMFRRTIQLAPDHPQAKTALADALSAAGQPPSEP